MSICQCDLISLTLCSLKSPILRYDINISKTLNFLLGEKILEAEPCGGERKVQLEHHSSLQVGFNNYLMY